MTGQSLYHSFQRYRTLRTHRVTALPIVILMPHSACNCRCVMCDIWKDNKNLRQLTVEDVKELMNAFRRLGTQQVLMSGGEALLNPNFFHLCGLLKKQNIHISLLSTGIGLKKSAGMLVEYVDDIIVSLDGDATTHDEIRNIPGAFTKLQEGIHQLRSLHPLYPITARTVIHRLNFKIWSKIITAAKTIGLDQVSFLPADVSSQAFNRETSWNTERQSEVALSKEELPELRYVIDDIVERHRDDFASRFIAESREKLNRIYTHYSALHGLNPFPYKKCNAPWVSTVIEPDGTVKPCFFHPAIGNIREHSLQEIINGRTGLQFRKGLDMDNNDICKRCVCALNLPAFVNPVK